MFLVILLLPNILFINNLGLSISIDGPIFDLDYF